MKTLTKCEVCNYGYFIEEGHNCGFKEKIARIRHPGKKNNRYPEGGTKKCPLCRTEFEPLSRQVYCGEECRLYARGKKVDKKQD